MIQGTAIFFACGRFFITTYILPTMVGVWCLVEVRIHTEIISESCLSKPNLYCNYPFPIDLTPNRIPFIVISIGKV